MADVDTDPLAQRLTSYGYAPLLGEHPDQRVIESVKAEPDIARRLQSIINDRSTSWQARFLASEFLFRYVDMTAQRAGDRALLEDSYFQALRHNYTGNGLDWGFGKAPDHIGVLGLMVVDLGKDAVFKTGLGDARPLTMTYSWGTPDHFRPPYRVKDFSALILARAHGLVMDLSGEPQDRDRAIADLETKLT